MKDKIVKGTLILEQIAFNRILERTVLTNNKTSGKVTLPLDLVGKKVYVVVREND
jgi:putative transposon-encoded protein